MEALPVGSRLSMASRREFIAGLAPGIAGVAALAGAGPVLANGAGRGMPAADRYRAASDRAVAWLLEQRRDDGGFGPDAVDMTCYHKAAYLFGLAGETAAANRILSLVKARYLQPDGDFLIAPGRKVQHVNYNELTWGYSNGWFALAAHRAGRFDISWPAYAYLQRLRHAGSGGYTSTAPHQAGHPVIELLATAHCGTLDLYLGNRERATAAADLVRRFETAQPGRSAGMFLRMDGDGAFILEFPAADAAFYFLDATAPGQFYFVPGYAAAFLCQMYLVTGTAAYLESARAYVDFAAGTAGVFDTHFSHKLAWGASLLYRVTGESRYRDIAARIVDVIADLQGDDGAWFGDQPPHVALDQTAECAIWLRTVPAELDARTV